MGHEKIINVQVNIYIHNIYNPTVTGGDVNTTYRILFRHLIVKYSCLLKYKWHGRQIGFS